ncbi:MAG TPA: hypothetical protein VFS43_27725 [Polyangiaceae bacterium]|nr:hypothetical protein [Polyangiaceae bacterium]
MSAGAGAGGALGPAPAGAAGSRWNTRRARSLGSACVAAVLYGGWAFAANAGHGADRALRSGATQALLSFVQTLAMALLMEALFRLPRRPEVGCALAAAGALAAATTCTVTLHVAVGTPEVARTVTPVLSLGAVFFALYSLNLLRMTRREGGAAAAPAGAGAGAAGEPKRE